MKPNILQTKSFDFALRIVKLTQHVTKQRNEFNLSKKILDSGTSIGMFIEESRQSDGYSEFVQKLSVANKEAFKSNYWLRLLRDSTCINASQDASLLHNCEELQKMLVASLKTVRAKGSAK